MLEYFLYCKAGSTPKRVYGTRGTVWMVKGIVPFSDHLVQDVYIYPEEAERLFSAMLKEAMDERRSS